MDKLKNGPSAGEASFGGGAFGRVRALTRSCGKITSDVFNGGVNINETSKVNQAKVTVVDMLPLFW
jgi:hypothetical protein